MSLSLLVAIERVLGGGRVPRSGLQGTLSDAGLKAVPQVHVHKGSGSLGLPKKGCVVICVSEIASCVHALSST